MTDRPILILGTGTFAEEIAEVASEVSGVTIAGFVENLDRDKAGGALNGLPIRWVDELSDLADSHRYLCGLGTTKRGRFTDQADLAGVPPATIVHPLAIVAASTTIGPGCVVGVGVIIASHTVLDRHVCVNRGASVGHHTQVGEFVTIGPGVTMAGNCRIGPRGYFGIGATVIDHITTGDQCVVGGGAVVTKEVPERSLVVGVPARVVKSDIDGK